MQNEWGKDSVYINPDEMRKKSLADGIQKRRF